jgi:uncharacterized protein (DUF2249 family)
MKEINLTKGKVALVDDEDYEYLLQWKWYAVERGCGIWYAARHTSKGGKSRIIFMHRVILQTSEGLDTDHRNGNGLDNRRENLRSCSHMNNIRHQSRRLSSTKSSLFKGVYLHKDDNLWRVKITVNKKVINIGEFKDETKAALAYNNAATRYFGEFAKLNVL